MLNFFSFFFFTHNGRGQFDAIVQTTNRHLFFLFIYSNSRLVKHSIKRTFAGKYLRPSHYLNFWFVHVVAALSSAPSNRFFFFCRSTAELTSSFPNNQLQISQFSISLQRNFCYNFRFRFLTLFDYPTSIHFFFFFFLPMFTFKLRRKRFILLQCYIFFKRNFF